MDLRNTPMEEQFSMLTFLTKKIKNSGSYLFQYLKTKNQYQISFVNSPSIIPKFLADTPIQCLSEAIQHMALEYKKDNNIDFIDAYKGAKDNEFLKLKLAKLEKEIEELKKHNQEGYLGSWPADSSFLDFPFDLGEEPEEKKPKPKSKSNKNLRKKAEQIAEETHLEKLLDREDNFPFDLRPEYKYPTTKRKYVKRTSGVFSEAELHKEMLAVHKGKDKLGIIINTIADIKSWSKHQTLYYEKEKHKAYKRLYGRMYRKKTKKIDSLNVRENKFGIQKSDVVKNMKEHLGEKYNSLSPDNYLKEGVKAKSRVWSKEHRKSKRNE